ncbi:bifunctional indole-3-glycerol-phosphate synthase TrpC/phosphoribosylanthranilate isomerase TrpF [Shewanella sp. OMA3-2]|uniref:bifunctional indole-3-glycerol-phosphate synthase TrpC/phosphoribosylanthranilate isomerase TrpF n=1 Tax=Shewanella sp. OMA3-2 TaxID=2908650 RepID=UPI001F26D475|nr:bifunctional indole-3-glycerol-phosphate synthase TrpC/phosphoribosylanthranilate isomerase TrpF [Shewanella sp. OMA3-2]UJF21159.1 bifunctional indole-3-glycerol-phosphate synthase TrpC/phosphoribosylanthranilate isomerase TrpF [Shewanella sp. OMA3-2]
MNQANQAVKETNVLTKIVDTKVAHIAALKLRFPEATLQPKISDRSLFEALKQPNAQYIFECKKASPSKGLIRPVFDVEAIADIYTKYAAGISVLTDEAFFQGDMDYIPQVRARVTQPILCKDFFVDVYQIKLAAHQGADAVLLMLSVLDDAQYKLLAEEAAKYQLDTLTEVSNEEELHRAIDLNALIIGINNRNLRDLSTDLATTEQLAPHIPSDRVVISESGIYSHDQVKRLNPLVNGYLVGSSIMAQQDIDLACRQLLFGNNKVCGLTRIEDIKAVADLGGVYGGLIFHPESPRAVNLTQAKSLVKNMRTLGISLNMVGVFVNADIRDIVETANTLELHAVQLHGSETALEIAALAEQFNALNIDCAIWKAIAVDSTSGNIGVMPKGVQRYLYDSKNDQQFGGTGQAFNWQLAIDNKAQAMLAGGLNVDNAYQASQQGFYGLDFNSGVESTPGNKDHLLLAQVFNALRRS